MPKLIDLSVLREQFSRKGRRGYAKNTEFKKNTSLELSRSLRELFFSQKLLAQIAHALGITVEELFQLEDGDKKNPLAPMVIRASGSILFSNQPITSLPA